eukprot:s965_g3.t1
MSEPAASLASLWGAQGLAALWMTSSQVLGDVRPASAISGFTRRPEVPVELLLLSAGVQLRTGHEGCFQSLRGILAAAVGMTIALLRSDGAGVTWNKAVGCQLLLLPWWDPDGCPLPYSSVASALFAALLAVTCSSLERGLLTLDRQGRLWQFTLLVWFAALIPSGYIFLFSAATPAARELVWTWPLAKLVDILLGACVARKPFASWQGGAADVLCVILVLVLLLPIESLQGFQAAKLGSLGLALTLGSAGASLLARFLAHPALVGLGKTSWEAIFLCGPLLEMCGQYLGPNFQRSAPGFLAFNFCLWTLASNLATGLRLCIHKASSDRFRTSSCE